ncbi:PadR family transcriptional regulator [Fodinicola feengrottensis]|uniref:PadR family transcriptional regulator n=1 Tax=Fodinicola feengrottensis TaxID=435914 RepID=UPI002443179D|nr:PadR family transcriptional regulator [Fodinicola feengrottensis]
MLGLLFEKPLHPYDMVATLRDREKHDSINIKYGSLYTVVRALERDGLIVGAGTVREGRYPERTLYEITPAGRVEFHDWLAELIGTPQQEFPQFLAGLSLLPGLPPAEAANLLEARAEKTRRPSGRVADPAGRAASGFLGGVRDRGRLPAHRFHRRAGLGPAAGRPHPQ